ncbi:hypothetical protein SCE1572_33800 [Sorangium cellulosum So0157-2]|uniref:Uncharacterized protein n=1 Tax=Sorangium cellulosum So0157-2 TaxID=1254432 RepID=S4Y3J6_SORCE|nr:hypothetical protein SCE1572_33800 [Sorangium cellulosum So0157-2]
MTCSAAVVWVELRLKRMTMMEPKIVHVGPYPLRLPELWYEEGDVREKPGFFGYNAVAIVGVSFDFYVLVGRGRDEEERRRHVDGFVKGKAPLRHLRERTSWQGMAFEQHRLEECTKLAPGAVYELFLCEAYGDLLLFGFGFVAPLEQEESLRTLFTTMVSGAIVERGHSLHGGGAGGGGGASRAAAKPKRSWWPLFRWR